MFGSLGLRTAATAAALPLVQQGRNLVPLLVQLGLLVALADLASRFATCLNLKAVRAFTPKYRKQEPSRREGCGGWVRSSCVV